MANTANNIKNSWSFVAFAREHGGVKYANVPNKQTGEMFDCLAAGSGDDMIFISFSRNLGHLSPAEVVAQKNDLQVVLCETAQGKDMYALCKKGTNSWQELNI